MNRLGRDVRGLVANLSCYRRITTAILAQTQIRELFAGWPWRHVLF
jgi:hypothetical protein